MVVSVTTVTTAISAIQTAKQGVEFAQENEEELRELGGTVKKRELDIEKGDLNPRAIRSVVEDEEQAIEAFKHTFDAINESDNAEKEAIKALSKGIKAVTKEQSEDYRELKDAQQIINELEENGLNNQNMVNQAVKELVDVANDLDNDIQVEAKILKALSKAEKIEKKEINEEEVLEDEEEQFFMLIEESEEITKRYGDKKLYKKEEALESRDKELEKQTEKEEETSKKLLNLTDNEMEELVEKIERTEKEAKKLEQESVELRRDLSDTSGYGDQVRKLENIIETSEQVQQKAQNALSNF